MSSPTVVLGALAAGDPDADRVVYGIVIALVVIGVVLIGIGVWVFRQTRADPELLAPLERMNDRSWSRRDPATQRRMLDEVRPEDAVPLHREPKEPTPVEDFDLAGRPVESLDDLKDPESGDVSVAEDDTTAIDEDGSPGGEGSPDGDAEAEAPVEDDASADEVPPDDVSPEDAAAEGEVGDDDVGDDDVADDDVAGDDVGEDGVAAGVSGDSAAGGGETADE